MSDTPIVLLRTSLFADQATPPGFDDIARRVPTTEFAIDPEAMTHADWDRVLAAILDHDRCITL